MAEHNMRQSVFAPNETEPEFQKLRRASAEVAAAGVYIPNMSPPRKGSSAPAG